MCMLLHKQCCSFPGDLLPGDGIVTVNENRWTQFYKSGSTESTQWSSCCVTHISSVPEHRLALCTIPTHRLGKQSETSSSSVLAPQLYLCTSICSQCTISWSHLLSVQARSYTVVLWAYSGGLKSDPLNCLGLDEPEDLRLSFCSQNTLQYLTWVLPES